MLVLVFVFSLGCSDLSVAVDTSKLQDADPAVRLQTIEMLPKSNLSADEIVALMMPLLQKDADVNVRNASAQVLVSLDPAACRASLPELKELMAKEKDASTKSALKFLVGKLEKSSSAKP